MSRVARLAPLMFSLALGCATGGDDPYATTFGGPLSGGGDTSEGSGGTEGSGDSEGSATSTSGSSADGSTSGGSTTTAGGEPTCCEAGPQPGCGRESTEACVCTSEPACCDTEWTMACVNLAAACGDPECDGSAEDSTGNGVELECDPTFAFDPPDPGPGMPFTATFTDPVGLAYVGMDASGPTGTIEGEWGGVTGNGPYTWTYGFDGLSAGVWSFVFTHRTSENGPDIQQGTCDMQF